MSESFTTVPPGLVPSSGLYILRKWKRLLLRLGLISLAWWSDCCSAEEVPDGYAESALHASSRVRVVYYYVSAGDAQGVRRGLDASGPRDPQGNRRDALTTWRLSWRWPSSPSATAARFLESRCDLRVEVTLPKWEALGAIPPSERARWREFTRNLANHELEHVKLALEAQDAPCVAIRRRAAEDSALTPAAANQVASEELSKLQRANLELDRMTDNGRIHGARFP